jgi:hypothetical protein
MPFTVSHVAAVLPFARTPLVPAALVIGSVTPDLFYFIPVDVERGISHDPLGAVTLDLGFGLLVFALWQVVFRRPVTDFAPLWLRTRIATLVRPPRGLAMSAALVVASLLVGIATHLAWDSLTHEGWPVLAAEIGPMPLYSWLQHASSVGGMVVLIVWFALWVRRTRPGTPAATRLTSLARGIGWTAVIGVGLAVGLRYWTVRIGWGIPPLESWLVFFTVRVTIGTAGLVALVLSLAWWMLRLRAVHNDSPLDDRLAVGE